MGRSTRIRGLRKAGGRGKQGGVYEKGVGDKSVSGGNVGKRGASRGRGGRKTFDGICREAGVHAASFFFFFFSCGRSLKALCSMLMIAQSGTPQHVNLSLRCRMSYQDFMKTFTSLEVVHLDGETSRDELSLRDKTPWQMKVWKGHWQRGVTAGGCRNHTGECDAVALLNACKAVAQQR